MLMGVVIFHAIEDLERGNRRTRQRTGEAHRRDHEQGPGQSNEPRKPIFRTRLRGPTG
jgi:hypothetical protein